MNKVVARFTDGRMVKGFTNDFLPAKDRFHVTPAEAPPGSEPVEIQVKELKAVFFVKDFAGNPQHKDRLEFDPSRVPAGRKIKVVFADGEVLVGVTQGYQPGRPGFFLVPADPQSNIERCYVVTGATQSVGFV
jgi:hypothetical protein